MRPTTTRRSFLAGAATVAGASAFCPLIYGQDSEAGATSEPRKKQLLILGGTVFLGPQIVKAALAAGYEVTLFNRGKSAPDLFPDLDLRVGDRNTGDYASLAEGSFDLVIDTSCYIPGHVTAAIEALGDRVKHYVVVSTLSVYAEDAGDDGPIGEEGKISPIEEDKRGDFKVIRDINKEGGRYYGALKALCEEAAKEAMPDGAVTVVRPGLIVGPGDRSDRYTYWPVRVAKGGDVLAPGDPEAGVQFVDVRDLGPFTFDVGARALGKTYNAVGFEDKVTMAQMLESCVPTGDEEPSEVNFVWVDDEFLLAQEVGPWMELPLWIPGGGKVYLNGPAMDEGLGFRDLADTAEATRLWHESERKDDYRWRAGMSAEKETSVLDAWAAR